MWFKDYFDNQYEAECAAQGDNRQHLMEAGIMDTPAQHEASWNTLRGGFGIALLTILSGFAAVTSSHFNVETPITKEADTNEPGDTIDFCE